MQFCCVSNPVLCYCLDFPRLRLDYPYSGKHRQCVSIFKVGQSKTRDQWRRRGGRAAPTRREGEWPLGIRKINCICVFVFVYWYLCICICVFVFVFMSLYLCICICADADWQSPSQTVETPGLIRGWPRSN